MLTDPQYDIVTSVKQRNLFLSGQGGGKTHCAGNVSAIFISNFPTVRGLIAANTHSQLNRSTLFRIREVWEHDFGMAEYNANNPNGCYVIGKKPPPHFNTKGHNYERYDNIISFDNGCVVYIGSLENYKALDGMEIGWAILDETKDTREEAVKEVITGRLRQSGMYVTSDGDLVGTETEEAYNPLFVFTSPAKVQWLNEWFNLDEYKDEIEKAIHNPETYFKLEQGIRLVIICSTYHNAENLPKNYITNRIDGLSTALVDMLIYGNPFAKSGGEFYKEFDRSRQVGTYEYNPDLPIFMAWDFNVRPYVTCNLHQIDGKHAYQFDEICLESPNNRTADVCDKFIEKYGSHLSGLFICGDPAGKSEDTRSEEGSNDYTIIKNKLSRFKPREKILDKAPSVTMRANFINTVFEKGFEGLHFTFDTRCKNTINDYIYLKEAADGTKFKEKVQDENDKKISYEKYGHTSDANDYLYCAVFANEYSRFQNGIVRHKPMLAKKVVKQRKRL